MTEAAHINLRVVDESLADEQIEAAENAQCDAICKPSLYGDGDGGVICTGCGSPVWLVDPPG